MRERDEDTSDAATERFDRPAETPLADAPDDSAIADPQDPDDRPVESDEPLVEPGPTWTVDLGRWDPELVGDAPPAPVGATSVFPRDADHPQPRPRLDAMTAPSGLTSIAPPAPILPPPRLPKRIAVAAPLTEPDRADAGQVIPGPLPPGIVSETDWPGAPIGWEPQEVDPRGLLGTEWMRPLVLFAQSLVFPALVAGGTIALVAVLVMMVVQAMWWAAAAENARRVKPSTPLRTPPGPRSAVTWWFVPLAVTGIAGLISVGVADWSEGGGSAIDRDVVAFLLRVVAVVAAVAAWHHPYARLVRVAKWVGGNSSAIRKWFWWPLAVSVLMIVQVVLLSLSVLGGFGEDPGSSTIVVASMWVSVIAPIAVTLTTGRRAMLELDGAAKELYQKRSMPPLDPADFIARRERLFGAHAAAAEGGDVDVVRV